MKQKLIGLTERQQKYLGDRSKDLGIPVSELIRRILDEHIEDQKTVIENPFEEKEQSFPENSK